MEIAPPNLRSHRRTSHVTLDTSQAREEQEEPEDNMKHNHQPVGRGNTFRMDQQQIAKLLQALVQVLQGADGGIKPPGGENTGRYSGGGKSKHSDQDRAIEAWRRNVLDLSSEIEEVKEIEKKDEYVVEFLINELLSSAHDFLVRDNKIAEKELETDQERVLRRMTF